MKLRKVLLKKAFRLDRKKGGCKWLGLLPHDKVAFVCKMSHRPSEQICFPGPATTKCEKVGVTGGMEFWEKIAWGH